MIRSILLHRGPLLAAVYPLNMRSNAEHDRPVNKLIKPLVEDELGWDRVKKIFRLNEDGRMTKELLSIINITSTSIICGVVIGGSSKSKDTILNFISSNEATQYANHFEAKQKLQNQAFLSFLKNGAKVARPLGIFCFMFSTLTACTTAYRGKLRIENYMFSGFVTGFLTRLNLGLTASLVGGGLGGTLGGICGGITIFLFWLTNTTMDDMTQVQYDWLKSHSESKDEKIRTYMAEHEEEEVKQLFQENQKLRLQQQENQEARKKVEDSS